MTSHHYYPHSQIASLYSHSQIASPYSHSQIASSNLRVFSLYQTTILLVGLRLERRNLVKKRQDN